MCNAVGQEFFLQFVTGNALHISLRRSSSGACVEGSESVTLGSSRFPGWHTAGKYVRPILHVILDAKARGAEAERRGKCSKLVGLAFYREVKRTTGLALSTKSKMPPFTIIALEAVGFH